MDFKLFGRLRGDESSQGSSDSGASNVENSSTGMESFGGGIQRTVENLFDQGYSEEEVRQELEGQYSENEIQQAINRAVTTSATEQDGPEPMTPYRGGDEEVSPMDEGFGNEEQQQEEKPVGEMNDQQPMNPGIQNQQPLQTQGTQQQESGRDVEELIETIVAENFQKVENEFENAYKEIDQLREDVDDLQERVHDLEVRDDEDQTQFIQKMDEIENDIQEYQSRIGGLEKAFQQVLPSLVDNVRDLTQLVQEIKQERGIETSSEVSENDIEDIDMEDW